MGLKVTHTVLAELSDVWVWHTRPGAIIRLSPPFLPMRPITETDSLKDGTTVFGLPAWQKWVAHHDPNAFEDGRVFRDVVQNQPFRAMTNWSHTHTFESVGTHQTRITDNVKTRIPGALLAPAWAYRQRRLIGDMTFLQSLPETESLTVAVSGASGLVGTQLRAQLTTAGHSVIKLVRKPEQIAQDARYWNVDDPASDLLDGVDAVIHLAGEPIFGRFDEDKKRRIKESRIEPTRKLAQLAAASGVKAFVSASAVGFYGTDAGDREYEESDSYGKGFLAEVCQQWENAARVDGIRTVQIRTGLVLSGAGGLLPVMRASALSGMGARFGTGNFWMSWVDIDDLTDLYIRAVVDDGISGPVNATAPNPVTNAEFSDVLTKVVHRPHLMAIPKFGPVMLLGVEGAHELALANQRAVPTVALTSGAQFRYDTLDAALAHELGREALVDDTTATP